MSDVRRSIIFPDENHSNLISQAIQHAAHCRVKLTILLLDAILEVNRQGRDTIHQSSGDCSGREPATLVSAPVEIPRTPETDQSHQIRFGAAHAVDGYWRWATQSADADSRRLALDWCSAIRLSNDSLRERHLSGTT
jgi:hypothetical protein